MQNRLYLSRDDKKISGVCGGIAEFFQIDPTIVRLLWLIMVFVYGTGIVIYIIASIIIPEEGESTGKINLTKDMGGSFQQGNQSYKDAFNDEKNKKLLGYGLIIIGAVLFGKRFVFLNWISFKVAFPVILIGLGIFVLTNGFKK